MTKSLVFIFGFILVFVLSVKAQSAPTRCDPSLGLSKMEHMPPKGRLQEYGSPQATRVIELNKKAIPLLIACLTDETPTKKPIEDYWPVTTVGDIAFLFLCDLFTDSSWQHSTINDVVNWNTLEAAYPNQTSFDSWYSYLKEHGRKHVQDVWYERWKQIDRDVIWDQKEQCFKVDANAARSARQH